jgi:CheY-like chemotaxis protein
VEARRLSAATTEAYMGESWSDIVANHEGTARRVMLVDARSERRELMRWVIEGSTASAMVTGEADDGPAALALLDQNATDVIVMDVERPVNAGMVTIASLHERCPDVPIIVCSFERDPAVERRAIDAGADRFLHKPLSARGIRAALDGLLPEVTQQARAR